MNLPGVRTAMSAQQRSRLGRKVAEPSLHERCGHGVCMCGVGHVACGTCVCVCLCRVRGARGPCGMSLCWGRGDALSLKATWEAGRVAV
jgi:hypothetical protein